MQLTTDEDGEQTLTIEREDDLAVMSEALISLRERAQPIAQLLLELKGIDAIADEDNIYIEGAHAYLKYYTYHCGERDEHDLLISSEYLFNEEKKEELKTKVAMKRKADANEAKRKALAEMDTAKRKDYEQYLKLKQQFEGGLDAD